MKKTYEAPDIRVMTIMCEDILNQSPNVGGGGGDDIITPDDEF